MSASGVTRDLLKMSELAELAGVPAGTVRHYLKEGLLGEPVRTARNMAWYPPEFVEKIKLIRRLQEDRFMPLGMIRETLAQDPQRVLAMLEREDRIIAQAAVARERGGRISRAAAKRTYGVPFEVLDELERLGFLKSGARGYDADEIRIIDALGRLRASGFADELGFTLQAGELYREALAPLAKTLVAEIVQRLEGTEDAERAAEIVAGGIDPLHELAGAILARLLLDELERIGAAS